MTLYVVKVGGAGFRFPSLISRKSALISHDFNLISTDFSTRCTRFLSLPTPRLICIELPVRVSLKAGTGNEEMRNEEMVK